MIYTLKKMLCGLGLHMWGKWSPIRKALGDAQVQDRTCATCNKYEIAVRY